MMRDTKNCYLPASQLWQHHLCIQAVKRISNEDHAQYFSYATCDHPLGLGPIPVCWRTIWLCCRNYRQNIHKNQ
jgi:hypothetical protein